jgi:RNA polymerase sigma-70 factor (ECF subfamily)
VLALLARRYGDLDLADEAVQQSLLQALESWPASGLPDNPPAWLFTVANHKAIDMLRRRAAEERRLLAAAPDLVREVQDDRDEPMIYDEAFVGDEQLRLMLLCCHPALDADTRVALTLRLVGGLTTGEIAQAFLLPEATLAQRIVRAKHKIRAAGIPLSIPTDLADRVSLLVAVLYLIFNEGYLSRGPQHDGIRVDLVNEAIRLTSLATELLPETAELEGLLALELFTHARLSGRTDVAGELVLLADQDRTEWDRHEIDRANAVLSTAMARMQPGPLQFEALIAAHHANPPRAADTDWDAIVILYEQLRAMTNSPVVALNHAAAVAITDGPAHALATLDSVEGLEHYYLFHALRAELLVRAGNPVDAAESFSRALALAVNPAERRHLERRLAALEPDAGSPTGARFLRPR